MSKEDEKYMASRSDLEQALHDFKNAADRVGMGDSDIASEIENCCFDVGIKVNVIPE